jgi:hypothetical protein
MPNTCIYKIDYRYRSSLSLAFDADHATAYVEAPENVWRDQLESMCYKKIDGFSSLNSFSRINPIKLA